MEKKEFTIKQQELIAFKKRRYVRLMLSRAIERGDMIKSRVCELCEKKCKTQSHHIDYGKPFNVIWLCSGCHGLVHRRNHHLNPENNPQTPLPNAVDHYDSVTVSFSLPIRNFLALQDESEKQGRPISAIMRDQVNNLYPVLKEQLEFNFEEKKYDQPPQSRISRIQIMAQDENILHEQKSPAIQKIRRKRNLNLRGVERGLFPVFS